RVELGHPQRHRLEEERHQEEQPARAPRRIAVPARARPDGDEERERDRAEERGVEAAPPEPPRQREQRERERRAVEKDALAGRDREAVDPVDEVAGRRERRAEKRAVREEERDAGGERN